MEQTMNNVLSNSTSVIAIVIGLVVIVGIIAYLIVKGKLNFKSNKFSIESAKQNTKDLLAECRYSCSLLALGFASKYIEKYPSCKYQILYISELELNRIEQMLEFNNITTSKEYVDMRFVDIKSIIDTHKIDGAIYNKGFYDDLYSAFQKMVEQIVLLKRHYKDND